MMNDTRKPLLLFCGVACILAMVVVATAVTSVHRSERAMAELLAEKAGRFLSFPAAASTEEISAISTVI